MKTTIKEDCDTIMGSLVYDKNQNILTEVRIYTIVLWHECINMDLSFQ